jgi:hypothetical protein
LGGLTAIAEAKEYNADALVQLVNDRAAAFREYKVNAAASRSYGGVRVDVFQTENVFSAFGLFTFCAGAGGLRPTEKQIGSDSASSPTELTFWRENYVVRVMGGSEPARGRRRIPFVAAASAVDTTLAKGRASVMRPPLLKSLPEDSSTRLCQRYFLGPESLSVFVPEGREMFDFAGHAEAVLAEYAPQGTPLVPKAATQSDSAGDQPRPAVKLLVVEYHTPQFATDALARVNAHIGSLAEDREQQTIVKREGNYIVHASAFVDRELAQQLVDSVKYDYTVKWLRNPLLPTDDPWRVQKAAQMLVSTFGLLGLMLLSVLIGGGAVGTVIFLKRRKRQLEVFSDAGGMLRLDLDPFDEVVLGLPPARSGDE